MCLPELGYRRVPIRRLIPQQKVNRFSYALRGFPELAGMGLAKVGREWDVRKVEDYSVDECGQQRECRRRHRCRHLASQLTALEDYDETVAAHGIARASRVEAAPGNK